MLKVASDKQIGDYLRSAIDSKFSNPREFSIKYLFLRDGEADSEEIRKLSNRIYQILKGTKKIQIDDLPYITELLEISCEEILTAGKAYAPVSSHITNYDIAFSHDREVWEKYMMREDKLFLNSDEYCKTVIDYALDFKNYEFIKYLLDKKFIWFVDQSEWMNSGFTYGAGTSVQRRKIGEIDSDTPLEIQYQDKLRLNFIALAIENDDFEILDSLRAREIPFLSKATMFYQPTFDISELINDELIKAISESSDRIVDYYSQEFCVKNYNNRENYFLYPFLDIVIKTMLKNGRKDSAELLIRRVIKHNKNTLVSLKNYFEEARKSFCKSVGKDFSISDELINNTIFLDFYYDPKSHMVSYMYSLEKNKYNGMVTNIFYIEYETSEGLIKELLDESNKIYNEIISLKREQNK